MASACFSLASLACAFTCNWFKVKFLPFPRVSSISGVKYTSQSLGLVFVHPSCRQTQNKQLSVGVG